MKIVTYPLLYLIRAFAKAFYRVEVTWIGGRPENPWNDDLRLIAILNHTSLYEPLLAGGVELELRWHIGRRGTIPVAQKTLDRPIVGRFFRLVAPNVVPITRQRDHTWAEFARRAAPGSLVIILPEGRMKRANGLDKDGKLMTVRGGIADLLAQVAEGTMMIAYSGGLHHVQVPGQTFPRLFQPIKMGIEILDIPTYLTSFGLEDTRDRKLAIIEDLERRRDTHCVDPRQPTPYYDREGRVLHPGLGEAAVASGPVVGDDSQRGGREGVRA